MLACKRPASNRCHSSFLLENCMSAHPPSFAANCDSLFILLNTSHSSPYPHSPSLYRVSSVQEGAWGIDCAEGEGAASHPAPRGVSIYVYELPDAFAMVPFAVVTAIGRGARLPTAPAPCEAPVQHSDFEPSRRRLISKLSHRFV
eukprot:6212816-Pleurochrysis_carterae.AAC.4